MAFLDNSGDIILDAVLTDAGRKKLAKGDGSFRIANYAFGDDEINYALYNPQHPSGSAYYDLEILKTPVLEAFTNNMSSMKSKLISISRTNLLYLPILKVNNGLDNSNRHYFARGSSNGGKDLFVVAVDQETELVFTNQFGTNGAPGVANTDYNVNNIHFDGKGVLSGRAANSSLNAVIRIDQGLDTDEIPPTFGIDADLKENQYIIEIDNRLGYLTAVGNSVPSTPNYIDDDDIASYIITDADSGYISENDSQDPITSNSDQVIAGPRGTFLQFKVKSSIELQSSTYLFRKLGTTISAVNGAGSITSMGFKHHFIDTNVRVTGITTGYTVDIPIRFVKYDTDIA